MSERAVVSLTSDALCVLRASPAAARFGVYDTYAEWFITEAGTRVYELARAVDPTFAAYNLARYVETTRALAGAARCGQQIVALGAGTDCRALSMPELAAVPVFRGAGGARVSRADVEAARAHLRGAGAPGPRPGARELARVARAQVTGQRSATTDRRGNANRRFPSARAG